MEIQTIQPFMEYFESIRGRTMRVIRAIPAENFDWPYREGKFTLADLIRHLGATERYMWAENAQGKPSRYPGHGKKLADGYENVLAFIGRMHGESMEIFSRLADEDLQKKCITPAGTPITIWKWLRAMVEHEIHHRGQIYLYLAILGVPSPPLYGMTSEQIRERSK